MFGRRRREEQAVPLDLPPTVMTRSQSRELISVIHPIQVPEPPPSVFKLPKPPCKPFVRLPPAHTTEPFRDIPGPFTLHRLFTILWLVGSGAGFFFLQQWLWPGSFENLLFPDLSRSPTWSWIGLIWLFGLPSAVASVIGNLMWYYDTTLDKVKPIDYNVVFRIVSRGTNADCLLETMDEVRKAMQADSLFPYLIEVVTDGGVFQAPDLEDVIGLCVPKDYETPNGTLYKARALHYACEYSVVPSDAWIVHLDEETRPMSSAIKGIARMIARTEESGNVRKVGQGAMLYHRSWRTYPFLTLCDMRRTGDDMGHFHLQHRIGFTIFGLHGSYIVCRQDVEQSIGFDLGLQGSITEDAWWILLAMEQGIRTTWVDGYMDEQSTQSIMDFLKQRRRWYVGLFKVSFWCPAKLRYRIFVLFNTLSWIAIPIFLPFIVVYMSVLSAYRFPVPFFLRILTNFIISAVVLVYFNGLVANFREHGTKWWKGVLWTLAMIVCLPACYFLEVLSVFMTFFFPFSTNAKGFHVVVKSATTGTNTGDNTASQSSDTTTISRENSHESVNDLLDDQRRPSLDSSAYLSRFKYGPRQYGSENAV